jgi:hypothetical protein
MRHWPTYRCCSVVNVYRHRPVKAKAPWSEDDRRCDSSVFHVLSVYVNGNRFLNVLQEHLWNCDVTSIEPPWSTLGIYVIIIHTSTNLNETLTDVPLLLRGQRLRAQTGKWRTPQWSDDDRRRGSSVFHVLPVSPQLTGTVTSTCHRNSTRKLFSGERTVTKWTVLSPAMTLQGHRQRAVTDVWLFFPSWCHKVWCRSTF